MVIGRPLEGDAFTALVDEMKQDVLGLMAREIRDYAQVSDYPDPVDDIVAENAQHLTLVFDGFRDGDHSDMVFDATRLWDEILGSFWKFFTTVDADLSWVSVCVAKADVLMESFINCQMFIPHATDGR